MVVDRGPVEVNDASQSAFVEAGMATHPSQAPKSGASMVRFGPYALDLNLVELRKSGRPIRLPPQASKVLALVASRPGELVTRAEIQQEIWGNGAFVDFEQGLNCCIKQVRDALGDHAEKPVYLETVPRRGYRFIARVQPPQPAVGVVESPRESLRRRLRKLTLLGLGVIAVVVAGTIAHTRFWNVQKEPVNAVVLAVLPFEDLSPVSSEDYFADGMTDALIADLAQIGAIRVISRTSVMHYKGIRMPLQQIARALKADVIVEGAVVRQGGRVRVTAQLIDAETDQHLWSQKYENDIRDILSLQRELARAIAAEIKVQLAPQEQARLASVPAVNPEAHEAYLRGRYYWNKRNEEAIENAIRFFLEATHKEPQFALAYAGLADSYAVMAYWEEGKVSPREALGKAKTAATRALELDPNLAEAHTSLAVAKMEYDWDWEGAEREFRRAIELNPSYATGRHWYSSYLAAMGRHNEAMEQSRRAQELDPFSLIINTSIGHRYYLSRKYDQAIEQYRRTLELDPNFAVAHFNLGLAHEGKGAFSEAIAEMQKALALSGGSARMQAGLGHVYGIAGRKSDAKRILDELKQRSKHTRISAYAIALVCVGLREKGKGKDETFEWLEKAYGERSSSLPYLNVDPRFDDLRQDPRFQNLVTRIGLPH